MNIFGLGGKGSYLLKFHWDDLFHITHKHDVNDCREPLSVRERLFFKYFGTWEHWLEENCEGKFGLTYNDDYILLYLESERDLFTWRLMFEDEHIHFESWN